MKKKNLIIVGVITAALVAAVVIYFINKDEEVSYTNVGYNESLSLMGETTATLIWYTKGIYPKFSDEYNYYYNHEKLNVSGMDKSILLNLVLYRLDRLQELKDGVVKESLVKKQFETIFGENVSYSKIDSVMYKCGKYVYAKEYSNYNEPVYYYVDENIACDTENNIIAGTIGSYKYDDRIEIIQAIGYTKEDGTYYDKELTNKITTEVLDDYTMLGNDHLFERYKYVFNYDKDTNKYYFYSVERHEGNV